MSVCVCIFGGNGPTTARLSPLYLCPLYICVPFILDPEVLSLCSAHTLLNPVDNLYIVPLRRGRVRGFPAHRLRACAGAQRGVHQLLPHVLQGVQVSQQGGAEQVESS